MKLRCPEEVKGNRTKIFRRIPRRPRRPETPKQHLLAGDLVQKGISGMQTEEQRVGRSRNMKEGVGVGCRYDGVCRIGVCVTRDVTSTDIAGAKR